MTFHPRISRPRFDPPWVSSTTPALHTSNPNNCNTLTIFYDYFSWFLLSVSPCLCLIVVVVVPSLAYRIALCILLFFLLFFDALALASHFSSASLFIVHFVHPFMFLVGFFFR
ncbi:hypothetical protein BJ165DRAFT_661906 [Panaeolus papilionaceus]|nr:hypothetical protein BJ165DRAFT_661906 [Panaeolus papilionaceus]